MFRHLRGGPLDQRRKKHGRKKGGASRMPLRPSKNKLYFINPEKSLIQVSNHLAGKNGQTIGMIMIDTMKQTNTKPVPALT